MYENSKDSDTKSQNHHLGVASILYDTFTTTLHADCVERVPGSEGVISVGTYELDESTRTRSGRHYLMRADREGQELRPISETPMAAGILDLKWQQQRPDQSPECAIALSNGSIAFCIDDQPLTIFVDPDSVMLAVAWDPQNPAKLACTTDKGALYLIDRERLQLSSSSDNYSSSVIAHPGMEVWTVAHSGNLVFTGGDDGLWKAFDPLTLTPTPAIRIPRHHQAGVCCLALHPSDPWTIGSSSYDETLAVWDLRNLHSPTWTGQAGSGVWRIRWHPTKSSVILAACMHDGFRVFDTDTREGASGCLAHLPTRSLAYGCDWVVDTTGTNSAIASCSFYDNTVQFWSHPDLVNEC